MSVSREVVQHVRDTVTLSSVVEQYTELSKSGSSGYMARCPFHDDKNPSMGVTDSKGLYHCFSCGASGDVIKFVMDIERCRQVEVTHK
jgi:DNA primase